MYTHARNVRKWADLAEDLAGLGYWWMDAATRELHWSANMRRIYGRPADWKPSFEEAMAQTHPDDRQKADRSVERSLSGTTAPTITRIVRPNGEVRHLEGRSGCEFDDTGNVSALYGTVQDITERVETQKSLEDSERRYRLLAQNNTDVIFCFNMYDGKISYATPSATTLLGYSTEELLGMRTLEILHPEDQDRVRARIMELVKLGPDAEPVKIEFRVVCKDRRVLTLESHPRLIFSEDGWVTEVQDVLRDVTERVAIGRSLKQAKDAAEKASAIKAEFLSNISHELRTPLTAITGYAGLLSEAGDMETARDLAKRIDGASSALLSLVNGLLDYSRLEAGRFTIRRRPVSPANIARECLELLASAAKAKGLALECDVQNDLPERVSLDPDAFRQIALNLAGNAVKFTRSGFVRLQLAYEGERLTMRVEDSGCGIDAADIEKLFQRFSQVHSDTTREHQGAGLGLAICKALCEAMGGEISVESMVGRGSVFTLALPAPAAADPASERGAPAPSLEHARILIADDTASIRELVTTVLRGAGAEVTAASTGAEALEMAFAQPFDLVFLDVRMPDMAGHAVAKEIRSRKGPNRTAPLVAFTASGLGQSNESFQAAGFDDVLRKPAPIRDILNLAGRYCSTGAAPQSNEAAA